MFGFKKKPKQDIIVPKTTAAPAAAPAQGVDNQEPTPQQAVAEATPPAVSLPEEFSGPVLNENGEPIEFLPPEIKLKVSSDSMKVYVKVILKEERQPFTSADLLAFLELNGIKYGILTGKIRDYCVKRQFFSELVAASGLEPSVGNNASIEYFFRNESNGEVKFVENERGFVDYRELNVVQSANAGQVLCTLTRETVGAPGIDVFGNQIPGKPGKPLELKFGENARLSDDGMSVVSTVDGCIDYRNGTVCVSELFTVRGDVNSSVGNLNCVGSIIINGDVREGFTVKASKDITIKGMVEGAHIIAGGNVTISNGMNGMNFGEITAGGNIVSKYLENSVIISQEGSILSDVIINCTTKAKESVILKGGKGSLIGGACTVGKMVYANCIGAYTNVPTSITLESPELRKVLIPDTETLQKKAALEAQLVNVSAERDVLQDTIMVLSQAADPTAKAKLKQLMEAKAIKATEVDQITKALKQFELDTSILGDYKVIALKTCFSGVKINVAYLYMHIDTDYSNTKFFISDHKLIAGQVLPSDKLK